MDNVEELKNELIATRMAFEFLLAPIIASHPRCDELLHHLSEYRRQVVGSRDPTKASLSEILDRLDRAARDQVESWS